MTCNLGRSLLDEAALCLSVLLFRHLVQTSSAAGEEQILVHARQHQNEAVENNHSTTVHADQTASHLLRQLHGRGRGEPWKAEEGWRLPTLA